MPTVIQDINSIYKTQFNGVVPTRVPLVLTTPLQLIDGYRLVISIQPKTMGCYLLSSTASPMAEVLVSELEWSLSYLGLSDTGKANFMLHQRKGITNPVEDFIYFSLDYADELSFIVEKTSNMIYIHTTELVYSQQIQVVDVMSVIYAFFQAPQSDCICKMLRLFVSTTVQEIYSYDGLNPVKVMSLDIRQSSNLKADFSLRGLSSDIWEDYSVNQNSLTCERLFNVQSNYAYPQEHSILQGRNPFISSHKITENIYFEYAKNMTGELQTALVPDGDTKFLRTKISSVLPTDSTGSYHTIDDLVLPESYTIVLHLMFKGTEGVVMEVEDNPEDYVDVEIPFKAQPDDINWHQVIIIKDNDVYKLYLDSVLQGTKEIDLPVLTLYGLLELNQNSGNLISVKCFDYAFDPLSVKEVYNGSFILSFELTDDMKKHLIYSFDSEGMQPQSWSDSVKGLTAFSNESLRVLETPDVQGVDYANLQYPK